MLTSCNQESLFGPEAPLFRGGAHLCTELLTGESKIAFDAVFSHVINLPFLCGAFVAQAPKNRPHISHSLHRSCRSNHQPCGRIPLCSNTPRTQLQRPLLIRFLVPSSPYLSGIALFGPLLSEIRPTL